MKNTFFGFSDQDAKRIANPVVNIALITLLSAPVMVETGDKHLALIVGITGTVVLNMIYWRLRGRSILHPFGPK
jgi:hypothetical protein